MTLLPERTLEQVIDAFPAYRQSLMGTVDNCALSARFDLEGADFNNAAQARGIIFHRFAAELLKTLQRTGETSAPHEEVMRILYEVSAQRDVPSGDVVIVPVRERKMLRMCALALADVPMNMSRLMQVETRLTAAVKYDGIERVLSGTPDALLAAPPNGAVVLDFKTTRSAPAKGEQNHWTGDDAHVSYEGYFQQRFYAMLVMRNFPSAEQVTLREYYVLPREAREAVVPREALEHIEQEFAVIAETLDRGLMEGGASALWRPSPGKHCGFCSRPSACPVGAETRMAEGGITDDEQAEAVAAQFVQADIVRKRAVEAVKAWHDVTSRPVPVKSAKGRAELRWGKDSGGRRRFGLHVPEASDRGPDTPDLAEAFALATERKET